MKQKTLFIDFDGTICFDLFWRSLDSKIKQKITDFLFVSNQELINRWMMGSYNSEEIHSKLSDALEVDYEYVWDVFIKDCKEMTIRARTIDLLQEARQTYRTVLITDNMDCFDRFTAPSLDLYNYFDCIENSYNYGMLKSEQGGGFFKKVLHLRQINIEDAILIDNSNDNCAAFERLGGKSIKVLRPEDIEHESKKLLSEN